MYRARTGLGANAKQQQEEDEEEEFEAVQQFLADGGLPPALAAYLHRRVAGPC